MKGGETVEGPWNVKGPRGEEVTGLSTPKTTRCHGPWRHWQGCRPRFTVRRLFFISLPLKGVGEPGCHWRLPLLPKGGSQNKRRPRVPRTNLRLRTLWLSFSLLPKEVKETRNTSQRPRNPQWISLRESRERHRATYVEAKTNTPNVRHLGSSIMLGTGPPNNPGHYGRLGIIHLTVVWKTKTRDL